MKMNSVMIVLANGFEETEAIGTADVLKRIGFIVKLAGLDSEVVASSAGTRIRSGVMRSAGGTFSFQQELSRKEEKMRRRRTLMLGMQIVGLKKLADLGGIVKELRYRLVAVEEVDVKRDEPGNRHLRVPGSR